MKAGIARALVLATALISVGLVFVGAAGAAPLVHPMNADADEIAVDGSDIYWIRDHMVRGGRYEQILFRSSFLNKTNVELARFGRKTGEVSKGLTAGGGYVVVSLENEFWASDAKTSVPTSRVIRLARDGSRREVIASGRIDTGGDSTHEIKNGVGYLNDCGTRVKALSVSATGSVAIGHVSGDRNSKRCGGKKNVDHWRYYEQRLDGSQREIFARDQAVKLEYKRLKRGQRWSDTSGEDALFSVQLVGERALIQSATSRRIFVRDFTTGILSGPFEFASKPGAIFNTASMATNGNVALNAFFHRKKMGATTRSGVFPAGEPTRFTELERDSQQLDYCGSRLISTPFDSRKIYELDPVTLARVRTVGRRPAGVSIVFGLELHCNENYVYGFDLKERPDGEDISVSLLAYPLNQP